MKIANLLFEWAIAITPDAMYGFAHTSLTPLYTQSSTRPLVSGNSNVAKQMLEKGPEFIPDVIEFHYFSGDDLMREEYHDTSEPIGDLPLMDAVRR